MVCRAVYLIYLIMLAWTSLCVKKKSDHAGGYTQLNRFFRATKKSKRKPSQIITGFYLRDFMINKNLNALMIIVYQALMNGFW